jgi:hypothetical protein
MEYVSSTVSTIAQKALTVTATAQSKTYDGSTSVSNTSGFNATGFVGNETISAVTLAYTDKNAGNANKTITVGGATAGANTSIDNYNITYVSNAASSITQKALTVTATTQTKTYDGSTAVSNASGFNATGFVGNETISAVTLAYTDKNAGNANKTITIGGATAGANTSLDNYNVTYVNSTTSTIAQKALTVTATAQSKTYNGLTTVSNASGFNATGFVGNETISAVTLAYTDKNAGNANKTITIGGATAGANTSLDNYNVTYVNSTGNTISKANITAITGVTLSDKVYDGTTSASFNLSGANFTGKVTGDNLTLSGGTGGLAEPRILRIES